MTWKTLSPSFQTLTSRDFSNIGTFSPTWWGAVIRVHDASARHANAHSKTSRVLVFIVCLPVGAGRLPSGSRVAQAMMDALP